MRKIVIDPRVIKHLGRDLITSPEVAIIELIKNSIDAKAKQNNQTTTSNFPCNFNFAVSNMNRFNQGIYHG